MSLTLQITLVCLLALLFTVTCIQIPNFESIEENKSEHSLKFLQNENQTDNERSPRSDASFDKQQEAEKRMSHHHATILYPSKSSGVFDQIRQQSQLQPRPRPHSPTLPSFRAAFPLPFHQRQTASNTHISPTNTKVTQYEDIQVLNKPASYESIVYNPSDSKEASSEFSRSNFWDVPELVVHDKAKTEEGKNSVITTSSRVEYTPNFKSLQTPLREIRYQNAPSATKSGAYRNRQEETSPQVFRNKQQEVAEEEDDESQNLESEDDRENEELNEDEEEEEEDGKRASYPVNLESSQSPFDPFENVKDTDDFYGQVLGNIESVFNDEHSSYSPPLTGNRHAEGNRHDEGVNSLLPQFEQHSFENLQNQERNEDLNENSDDYNEENEALEEEEENSDESKTIIRQKPATHVPDKPLQNIRHPTPLGTATFPRNHRIEEKPAPLKESPFPNVKILREKPLQPPQKANPPLQSGLTFSPWLPTASPTVAQQIQQFSQPRRPQIPEKSASQEAPKKIPKPNHKKKNYHSEVKPYSESTKTTINKTWSTYDPDENDESSYHSSWKEASTMKPEKGYYKKERKNSKDTQEGEESRTRPSSKVPRHVAANVKDSLPEE